MQRSIAIVVKGYPRLSETFIAQEIHALERRGLSLVIVSLRLPTDAERHAVHEAIRAPVRYLPEYLHRQPLRVLRGWWRARRMAGYRSSRTAWLSDMRRDFNANRIRRFGQALVLAAEMPAECHFLYAHFMHTPASVARYASLITGIPWACSAHAKDIWTSPEWEKREKLADCAWLVTCTRSNVEHLQALAADPAKVSLAYHGLDFSRFPDPRAGEENTPRGAASPLCILSVGRAVEKKGFGDLLRALARLPRDLHWRFVHIGGGPLAEHLRQLASSLSLESKVEWRGARAGADVLRAYREAQVFVLPSRIAGDGDRDGLPNVLLEAQSQRLPCVSTRVSGIPELIEHGTSGLLVEPGDVQALAAALTALLKDAALRERLGGAGYDRVRARFSLTAGIDHIVGLFPETVRAHEGRFLRTA